jgi:hypothetical protein
MVLVFFLFLCFSSFITPLSSLTNFLDTLNLTSICDIPIYEAPNLFELSDDDCIFPTDQNTNLTYFEDEENKEPINPSQWEFYDNIHLTKDDGILCHLHVSSHFIQFYTQKIKKHLIENSPFILRRFGTSHLWSATSRWSTTYFLTTLSSSLVHLRGHTGTHNERVMTFADFYNYMNTNTDSSPYYLFDEYFFSDFPEMESDYTPPMWLEWPSYFRSLPSEIRPPDRWVLVGGPRSGTGWIY